MPSLKLVIVLHFLEKKKKKCGQTQTYNVYIVLKEQYVLCEQNPTASSQLTMAINRKGRLMQLFSV